MPRFSRFVPALAVLLSAGSVHADTLLIERQERAAEVARPTKGMQMTQVEREFGAPVSKGEPVGDPPITRWTYASFSVYFEHSHVITSVLNKASQREQGPKPAQ
ncbi:MAG: hypothetical protein IPK97_00965 [Ahniella sp.]|nr:hypothetical protein [Ahniella sp.]